MSKIYLQAGNSNERKEPVELLIEAAERVEESGDVSLSYLYMQPSTASDDYPYIDIELFQMNADDLELRHDSVALMHDSTYTEESAFKQTTITNRQVMLLEVWNSMEKSDIENVGNIARLLRRAAQQLDELGNVMVIDMIMHSYIDEDALQRPYIRIYYNIP